MNGSVNNIDTFSTSDGPGIRTVVFLNGCPLRCKFCHNPEMFIKGKLDVAPTDILNKVKNYLPYYKKNNGGITFSGGEPLFQTEFLIDTCKLLKTLNIHVSIETSGIGVGDYETLLDYVDLIILDIKSITAKEYKNLTNGDISKLFEFLKVANLKNKKFWVRQVIIPGFNDNKKYVIGLKNFIKKFIKNVEMVELLPFHNMAINKYKKLNLDYEYKDLKAMDRLVLKDLSKFL